MMFVLYPLVYGGVHAGAWDDYFPTSVERLLWRVSAVYGSALGIAGMLVLYGYLAATFIRNKCKHRNESPHYKGLAQLPAGDSERELPRMPTRIRIRIQLVLEVLVSYIRGIPSVETFAIVAYIFYCFCRSLLIIEAFISLRQMPSSAYTTPSRPQYLPHL